MFLHVYRRLVWSWLKWALEASTPSLRHWDLFFTQGRLPLGSSTWLRSCSPYERTNSKYETSLIHIHSSCYLIIPPPSLSPCFVRTILPSLKSLTLFKRTTRSLTFSPSMMILTQRRHSVSSWSSDGVTVSNLTHTHSHTFRCVPSWSWFPGKWRQV